jgi:hypothetical protein
MSILEYYKKLKFIFHRAEDVVVVDELCEVDPSKKIILFSTLSILVPSSIRVNPSQVFTEKIAAVCLNL